MIGNMSVKGNNARDNFLISLRRVVSAATHELIEHAFKASGKQDQGISFALVVVAPLCQIHHLIYANSSANALV